MEIFKSLFSAGLLILFCFVSGQSQTKQPDAKDNSKPVEIKLNLIALNSENKFLDNVKPEDLKFFEDGVEQKITYFAKKEPVLNVGLVFDNSGSFRESLNEIISAGRVVVSNLNPNDEAFVVRFVSSDKIEVRQDWTSDKELLHQALDNLFIEGGPTAILNAIYLSAGKILEREKLDKSKRYGIILFSDAEDRESYYKLDEVSKLFKETDLQVFLLSYAESAPQQKKQALKLSNLIPAEIGGMVYMLPKKHTTEDLTAGLRAIITELRSNYIIGYTSSNPKRDGLPRKLTVQIADGANGEKRQAMIRKDFIVPKIK